MATINGTARNDNLAGTAQDDVVWGLAGADTYRWGGEGNDTFHAGSGGENYDANRYNTNYDDVKMTTAWNGGDTLILTGKTGALVVMPTTEAGSARIGKATLQFNEVERIIGTDGNDTIRAGSASFVGSNGVNEGLTISTGAGNDLVMATKFDDNIDGGIGNDTIYAGGGHDFIQSSTGNDLIYGGAGDENIRWGIGDAHWHNPGNDTIYGGPGSDLINVWVTEGPGYMTGGADGGHVRINNVRADGSFNGIATVGVNEQGGVATLRFFGMDSGWTHEGRDTIDGSAAKVVDGNGFRWGTRWGDDVIIGSRGNDTLEGAEGKDTITGGKGNDLVSLNGDFYDMRAPGDGDADVFVFNRGDGHDTLLAYDAGIDRIQSDAGYTRQVVSNGTMLTFESGDTILVSNVFDFA